MSNNINSLRDTLFATLQEVKTGTMEIDRARAVADVAQCIIATAKVEIDYAKATGADINSTLIETDRHRTALPMPERPSLVGQLAAASGGKR